MTYREQQKKELLVQEIMVMQKMNHKNLIKMFDAFFDDITLTIGMELLEGGDLTAVVEFVELDDRRISYVMRECLQGLEYLHSKNIIHRDLKSDNILLGNYKFLINKTFFKYLFQISQNAFLSIYLFYF